MQLPPTSVATARMSIGEKGLAHALAKPPSFHDLVTVRAHAPA
jgi:hypothetical protein